MKEFWHDKIELYNGALECQFRKYQLFDGKYKAFRQENEDKEFMPKRDDFRPRRTGERTDRKPEGKRRFDGERKPFGERGERKFEGKRFEGKREDRKFDRRPEGERKFEGKRDGKRFEGKKDFKGPRKFDKN